jgi:hypothetical protein
MMRPTAIERRDQEHLLVTGECRAHLHVPKCINEASAADVVTMFAQEPEPDFIMAIYF